MANEMGNQILESETNEPKEVEHYKIIIHSGPKLPPEFKNLIIAPFLNSLRYGNDLFKLIDKESYYSAYSKYIEHLLDRATTTIYLAVLDDQTVLGWSMVGYKTIHYIWVKKEVRRQGIGRSLLPKEFDTITHITNVALNIWASKFPNVRFNPFI